MAYEVLSEGWSWPLWLVGRLWESKGWCSSWFCGRAQELCESRRGRPGLPPLINKHTVSVDVKQHSTGSVGSSAKAGRGGGGGG